MKRVVLCLVAALVAVVAAGAPASAFAASTESEPNNTLGTADSAIAAAGPSSTNNTGDISSASDVDWWKFSAFGDHTYVVTIDPYGAATLDPQAELWLEPQDAGDPELRILRSDDAEWFASSPKSAWLIYSLHATPTFAQLHVKVFGAHGTTGGYNVKVGYYTPGPAPTGQARVDGADRYAVAEEANTIRFAGNYSGVTNVVVASGLDKAACDPLTASSLAGAYNAPLALINQDSATHQLPSKTKEMFQEIKADRGSNPVKIWLVGGYSSCPSWALTRIKEILNSPGQVTSQRFNGSDRYDLAAKIAEQVRTYVNPAETLCFVANGETSAFFYDALAASPVSFHNKWPILLTRKGSVPSATYAEHQNYWTKYVVGNDYEVSGAVKNKLAEHGGVVTRIGTTGWTSYRRQYVARYVAEYFTLAGKIGASKATYANKLADALTGGALAGAKDSPLLYTYSSTELDHSTWYPYTSEWAHTRHFWITYSYLMGGTASVSNRVEDELLWLTGIQGW